MKGIMTLTLAVGLFALASSATAGTVYEAGYSTGAFAIDGSLNDVGWAEGQVYATSFSNHLRSVAVDLYLAHDDAFLYIGIDTPMGLGWDSLCDVYLDGDHDGAFPTPGASPSRDVSANEIAPGAWSGYRGYFRGGVKVTPPSGYASARQFDGDLSYEFRFPISDFASSLNDSAGIIIKITEGYASKDTQYLLNATDIMKYSDPTWLQPHSDVPNWSDLALAPDSAAVPLPGAAFPGIALLAAAGLLRLRARRRRSGISS